MIQKAICHVGKKVVLNLSAPPVTHEAIHIIQKEL